MRPCVRPAQGGEGEVGRWPAGGPHPSSPASKDHRSGPVVPAGNLPPRKGDSTLIGQAAAWPRLGPSDLDSKFNASGRPDAAPISACVGDRRGFTLPKGRNAVRSGRLRWGFGAVVSLDLARLQEVPRWLGRFPSKPPMEVVLKIRRRLTVEGRSPYEGIA